MASALYLENFLESIEHFPKELQRNFSLMRDLDQRTQDTLREVEESVKDYKKSVSSLSQDERKKRLSKIDELYQKAKEYSDDKVQLAMQMYEMVDKHIRRLDNDLGRFEQELQVQDKPHRRPSVASAGEAQTPVNKGRKRLGDNSSSGYIKKRSHTMSLTDEAGASSVGSPAVVVHGVSSAPSDMLDMPVDPNEPTYCLCHQVRYPCVPPNKPSCVVCNGRLRYAAYITSPRRVLLLLVLCQLFGVDYCGSNDDCI